MGMRGRCSCPFSSQLIKRKSDCAEKKAVGLGPPNLYCISLFGLHCIYILYNIYYILGLR